MAHIEIDRRIAWRWFIAIAFVLLFVLASGTGAMKGEQPYQHMVRFAVLSAGGLMLLFVFPRKGFPRGLTPAGLVMVLAVLMRVVLLPMEYSDDMNRYLWEGRLVAEGINPYLHAPDDPTLATLAQTDPFHGSINLPHLPAAYPPLLLGIFSAVGALWYNPWAIKLLIVVFDLACVWFILQLLRSRQLDARWALLYAVNPVVLYAFAGEAHFDAIQNFFLLAAVLAFDRRRWGWVFLLAGLAIQSKYIALVACPFLLRRDNLKWVWTGVLAVVLPFIPFLMMESGNLFYSFSTFAKYYAYNGSIHILIWSVLDNQELATRICMIALMTGLISVFGLYSPLLRRRFRDDPITGMVAALSLLLLFAPTIHFWYLTWILFLIPLRPLRSWLLLSLTISVSFVTRQLYESTGDWMLPPALLLIEWTPVMLLLLWEATNGIRRSFLREQPRPESISVVIPTRNEAENIARCIQSISSCPALLEVVVVDGGSKDETPSLARTAGATVLQGTGGRGGQILMGIEKARGDMVVIIHADTLVSPTDLMKALNVLQRNPNIGGGAIGSFFDGRGWRLRLLECMNDFRAVFFQIGFGDQVQFFRRKIGLEKQVFAGIPLMEDVELSLRLGRIGPSIFLFGNVQVSARKWESIGYSRAVLIIRMVGAYLWLRLWGKADADAMYRQYYNVENNDES